MPVFLWEARTRLGEGRSGEMEAANVDVVKQRLRSQNLQIDKVKRKPLEIVIRFPGQTGVTTKDMVVFTRQFATMIDAGLPLVQCLDILGNQNDNPDFKKIILDVKATVESFGAGRKPKLSLSCWCARKASLSTRGQPKHGAKAECWVRRVVGVGVCMRALCVVHH